MANKPTAEDLAARQAAIDAGKTQYVRPSNGERYTIRSLGNPRLKKRFGGQGGSDESYVRRSGNRGNKVDNPRAFNLRHGSPPGTDIAEGDRAMARIRQQFPGMDADHINDIALSSAGASWKVQQGRGTYEDYFENMRRAGIPVGHVEENFAPLEPRLNQIVKNQDTKRVHKAIQGARGSFKGIKIEKGGVKFLSTIPFLAGGIAATGTILQGGSPADAAGSFVEAENPIEDLDAGPLFDESQDYGTAIAAANQQNQRPLMDRLDEGALGDAGRAIKRGPRTEIKAGSISFKLPEFGVSEFFGFNK